MGEKFKETKEAFAIQRGRLWVSQHNFPDTSLFQEHVRGQSMVVFAGADHLELNVSEARALRDWLTSVLPDESSDSGGADE